MTTDVRTSECTVCPPALRTIRCAHYDGRTLVHHPLVFVRGSIVCLCPRALVVTVDGLHSGMDDHVSVRCDAPDQFNDDEWEALVRTHLMNEVNE